MTFLKAFHLECDDALDFALRYIKFDQALIPVEQRDWKMGHTASWHGVHITLYRANQFFTLLEVLAMARKGTKSNGRSDFAAYVFVRCELRSEDKADAKIWIEKNTKNLGTLLGDVVTSDYKQSLSYSPDHDTYTASLTGKEDNAINGKKTLTARHKDWVTAVMTVLYKHLVMFGGEVWEETAQDDDGGWA